ncbi:GntR family transcriptional regulator [Clostridium paraputrificum]|uniref:GntR family transcriptional regulator n=1 Tax=Clostridium TaxID=1485 RepID=UPI003D34FB75
MKSKDIIRDLIEKITLGEIPIDSRIPSEAQLAIKYDCNRHTIRKVLESLIERGYLRKAHKGPTYVNSLPSDHSLTLSSFYELHKSDNIKTEVIKFKLIKASDKISNILKIDTGSKIWSIIRVRYVGTVPNHIEETYMPYSIFENLSLEHCSTSILNYVEEECGYEISHGIKSIKAIKLNNKNSNLLKLPEDSLALQIEHTGYLTNGRVYEYSVNTHGDNNITYYAKR